MNKLQYIGKTDKHKIYYDFRTNRAVRNVNAQLHCPKSTNLLQWLCFLLYIGVSALLFVYTPQLDLYMPFSTRAIITLTLAIIASAFIYELLYHWYLFPPKQKYEMASKEEFITAFDYNGYYQFNRGTEKTLSAVRRKIFWQCVLILVVFASPFLFFIFTGYFGYVFMPLMILCFAMLLVMLIEFNALRYWKIEQMYLHHKISFGVSDNEKILPRPAEDENDFLVSLIELIAELLR